MGLAAYVLGAASLPWEVCQLELAAYVLEVAFFPWEVCQLGLAAYVLGVASLPWEVCQLESAAYVLGVASLPWEVLLVACVLEMASPLEACAPEVASEMAGAWGNEQEMEYW